MPQVKGKQQLCICKDYIKNFKSIQRIDGHSLFERYDDIANIVNNKIDKKYQHFLAHPVIDGDDIVWFSTPYSEKPRRLTDLEEAERKHYEDIKQDTLRNYKEAAQTLQKNGLTAEAEAIESATKYVNDDSIYCFDNKTVLGVWGMTPRDEVRDSIGIAMQDSFERPKKIKSEEIVQPEETTTTHEPTNENIIPEQTNDNEEMVDQTSQEPDEEEREYLVRFDDGGHGTLIGRSEYYKHRNELIALDEVPAVKADYGYEFIGWDREPRGYRITDDIVFTALYRRHDNEEYIETENIEESVIDTQDENIEPEEITTDDNDKKDKTGWFRGLLNWLLLLLLLALIFMLIWCVLLKQCNFSFCGGGCGCDDSAIVDTTNYEPDENLKPCNSQVKSGGDEGYTGSFDMGQKSGKFDFKYNTGKLYADEITIYDGEGTNGKIIFKYNGVTQDYFNTKVEFGQPTITVTVVKVNPLDDETWWEFTVNCPEN